MPLPQWLPLPQQLPLPSTAVDIAFDVSIDMAEGDLIAKITTLLHGFTVVSFFTGYSLKDIERHTSLMLDQKIFI